MAMGWRVEDLVGPEVLGSAKEFECPICFTIWDDPVETSCCESTFCRDCITKCRTCVKCHSPTGYVTPVSKEVLSSLHTFQVHCPYRRVFHWGGLADTPSSTEAAVDSQPPPAKRTKSMACGWRGTYKDFVSKHQDTCQYQPVMCPDGCGETVLRCDLARHTAQCPLGTIGCDICGERVRPGEIGQHLKEAAEFHVLLLQDRLLQAQENAASAQSKAANLDTMLEAVRILPRKLDQHLKVIKTRLAGEVKREIRRQMTNSFVLYIPNGKTLRARTDRGCLVSSPKFTLCGHEFMLNMYPNGQRGDMEASLSTWRFAMNGDCDQKVHVRFTINDELSQADENWRTNMVYAHWPSYKAVIDSCVGDDIKFQIEILSMSDIAVIGGSCL